MITPLLLALCLTPDSAQAAAQRPSTAVATRQAWESLNAGRAREAATSFDQLLRVHPTDPGILLGAGVAAHQLGDPDAARRHLVDALRHDPSLTPASLLLGDVLYATGDLDSAIGTYERALSHAPDHKVLLMRLEAWRKELALHDRFAQKLGDHFTVLFEGPAEEDLARTAVRTLEAAYWRIGSVLNTYPAEASRSSSIRGSSSGTSHNHPSGPAARSTDGSASPSRVRCRTCASSSGC